MASSFIRWSFISSISRCLFQWSSTCAMRFSHMMFTVIKAVFSSAYSIPYCRLSRMGLLLGIQIGLPSSSTALLFTLAYCRLSSSHLFRSSSIPRYGYVLPNYVAFVVSTSFNIASTSFKCLLSMSLLNYSLNSSSSYSRQSSLVCCTSCICSFR